MARAFAAIAVPFSVLTGAVTTLHGAFGLSKFGGLEYVPRVLELSVLRELGPGVSVSAAFLALVVWGHPLDRATVEVHLRGALRAALVASALGLFAVVLLCVGSGFLLLHLAYDVPWAALLDARSNLEADDLAACAAAFAVRAAVFGALAWAIVPRLSRPGWSLLAKVSSLWLAAIALRVGVGIALWCLGG